MQNSLFEEATDELIELPGAKLRVIRSWLSSLSAKTIFENVYHQANWQNPKIKIAGQWRTIPRLQAWYGDDTKVFTYSGVSFKSEPMFDELTEIKVRLENEFSNKFNSVLVNCYRDGGDSVSWHADDEPEFGKNPTIASLSLGESRRFCLKPKPVGTNNNHQQFLGLKPNAVELTLNAGDLLVMSGSTQSNWLHCVPKESFACGPRINLTYRYVV